MAPLSSWLPIHAQSPFSLANLPFGIISTATNPRHRPAIAVGDYVLDLQAFVVGNGFAGLTAAFDTTVFTQQTTLNGFAALGRPAHRRVREYIQSIFLLATPHPSILRDNESLRLSALLRSCDITSHLPMHIGSYTDFFAGINHARNVGTLFRGAANALQPNYIHLPVAYHSRASSVVVSGTPVVRPHGQMHLPHTENAAPTFAPCRKLDFELELGAFICRANELGRPVPLAEAADAIFGYVLLNDWSARDLQQWEYVPLGPFNSKNFTTTISPWVVLADALEPFRCAKTSLVPNHQYDKHQLLPYLAEARNAPSIFDIRLNVLLTTPGPNATTTTISRTSSRHLCYSFAQMIAHHTVSGCNLQVGDLLGSGTISGDSPEGTDLGSLLEMNANGAREILLAGMETRTFLRDGDSVVIEGVAGDEDGGLVGFGLCEGWVASAIAF